MPFLSLSLTLETFVSSPALGFQEVGSERAPQLPPAWLSLAQSKHSRAHASHAACSLFQNRQPSGSYGSFQPPSVPNNPSSGAVSILSCRLPLGMREPSLGWINRCAVIFTRQLPALIPLLQPRRHPLIDNTLAQTPASWAGIPEDL